MAGSDRPTPRSLRSDIVELQNRLGPLVPTPDAHDAEQGTSGTPSAQNPFVTDSDPRLQASGRGPMEGEQGEDGRDGIPGLPGARGVTGMQGAPGLNGLDGEDGRDGWARSSEITVNEAINWALVCGA